MNKYTPDYADITEMLRDGAESVLAEELAQRKIAMNTDWLLGKYINSIDGKIIRNSINEVKATIKNTSAKNYMADSQQELTSLGFKILGEQGEFYLVMPPKDWSKETKGMWTTIKDAGAQIRIMQAYKSPQEDFPPFLDIYKNTEYQTAKDIDIGSMKL